MEQENNNIEELPAALIDELKARDRGVTVLTARADREIEAMAAAQFSTLRGKRRIPRPTWAALAASVLIAVLVLGPDSIEMDGEQAILTDLDGSGRIDIADVLHLARQSGSAQVSEQEIDAMAMQIVSLASWGDAS
jgi:hypothetical protein